MTYEVQPDSLPTNKAAAAGAISAIIAVNAEPVVAEIWPQLAPAMLSGPAFTNLLAALVGLTAGLIVAWWVPDKAGLPVNTGA